MKALSPQQLGWIAGVVDFKGKITRKHNETRLTPQLVLRVDTSNLAVVGELCRLTGVKTEPREYPMLHFDRRGCTEHCPRAHVHVEPVVSKMGYWRVTGAAAAIVLWNILPYMVSDERMTETMHEIIKNTVLRGRRGNSARQSVRRLVELGWKLPPGIAEQWAGLNGTRRRRAA